MRRFSKLALGSALCGLAACGSGDDGAATSPVVAQAGGAERAAIEAARPSAAPSAPPSSNARDPGPRGGAPGAGGPLDGIPADPMLGVAFDLAKDDFAKEEGAPDGLGPTMNLDSCGGCHLQPALGGSSPPINPQIAFAAKLGATNSLPSFLSQNGPVREARFVRNADGSPDGGVHALFTIAGRSDAAGCTVRQPDFATAVANRNVSFRIPTPVFGAGLIEQIPDRTILANMTSNASAKQTLGIRGRGNTVLAFATISAQPNRNGNDGTLGRFGWKAQNKSLLVFAGEAYNVEMGITNDLFPTERDETDECQYASQPNSVTDLAAATPTIAISSIEKFALFMRLLAAPAPSVDQPGGAASIASGKALFSAVGCALCHTPTLKTGHYAGLAQLRDKDANLFSDLVLHDMGVGLADGVSQGQAGPREFRTAPLWGLGQRLFFLHDGRTGDLRQAIYAHRSDGSEANGVIDRFSRLADREAQDLLNFLRSL
jgi:CxxC motif-containing protein (DUF1111 family)